jgi:hypothetical protein
MKKKYFDLKETKWRLEENAQRGASRLVPLANYHYHTYQWNEVGDVNGTSGGEKMCIQRLAGKTCSEGAA